MTESELRAIVRDVIAQHADAVHPRSGDSAREAVRIVQRHSSHAMFRLAPPDGDMACLIEPAVPCSHCGYCCSYGH